jgi:2-C-methyl-D-erythritol 4-phosphate cytidylyltransferase
MSWCGLLPRDVGVVVVAAGRGERLGGEVPKQFLPVAGIPLLLRAVGPFLSHPEVSEVVVALPADAVASPPHWLSEVLDHRFRIVAGGALRMDSVEAGFRALGPQCAIVLVHDGARPFPDPGVIDAIISVARSGSGAIAAVPETDTLKQADAASADGIPRVLRTVSRSGLWRAQTPQGFPKSLLEAAYAQARASGFVGTDDASLVERLGVEVLLVPDVSLNLKVTTPGDLRLAEALAGRPR